MLPAIFDFVLLSIGILLFSILFIYSNKNTTTVIIIDINIIIILLLMLLREIITAKEFLYF